MESQFIFRNWTDEDEAALLTLQETVFHDHSLASPEFFQWLYRDNPAGRAVIICCQTAEGKIVSQYATIPFPVRLGDSVVTGSLSLNTATHPDFRRLGLFVKGATAGYKQLLDSGVPFTFGFPNRNSYPGFVNKLSFTNIGSPTVFTRILDINLTLSEKVRYRGRFIRNPKLSKIFDLVRKPLRSTVPLTKITEFTGIPVESLWEPALLTTAANSRWLTWRYVAHPLKRYSIVVTGSVIKPSALAVYHITEDEVKKGVIMELFVAASSDIGAVETILDHISTVCLESGCSRLLTMVVLGSRKANLLRRCGFFPIPKRFSSPVTAIFRKHLSDCPEISLHDMDFSCGMLDTI